jgi:hypothetical protein
MAIKYTNIIHSYKIYPNCDFWLENVPSGNRVLNAQESWFTHKRSQMLSLFEIKQNLPVKFPVWGVFYEPPIKNLAVII